LENNHWLFSSQLSHAMSFFCADAFVWVVFMGGADYNAMRCELCVTL